MSSNNNLNMGMRCIKYMLFIINFMFVLTAILLITVGTTIKTIYTDFSHFLDDHFLSPPALLVAVGVILLIVATFGCIGAFKESTAMINIYAVLLTMIFILQVAAAISAYVLQGQVEEMLLRTMNKALEMYSENEYVADAVDFMQSVLQCCGVKEPQDWAGFLPDTGDLYNSTEATVIVPNSCCALTYSDEPFVCATTFPNGCLNRMHFVISQSAMLIATGATTVAFVQILGVICAFMLAKTIRRTKRMRAVRRWQLQQSLGIMANPSNNDEKPAYTQMERSEKSENIHDPVTYLPNNSPSVN